MAVKLGLGMAVKLGLEMAVTGPAWPLRWGIRTFRLSGHWVRDDVALSLPMHASRDAPVSILHFDELAPGLSDACAFDPSVSVMLVHLAGPFSPRLQVDWFHSLNSPWRQF